MRLKFLSYFDFILFFAVIILTTIGIFFIYSSGVNSSMVVVSNEYIKQIIFSISGLVLMIFIAIFDYRKLQRHAPKCFILLILVLIYTRIFGRFVNGAKSWIGIGELGVQPSEFCKILFILFLAWFLERTESMSARKRFIISLGIMFVPVALILLQPDLGTASVYIPIYLAMCFVAGIPLRYLFMLLLTGIFSIVLTVLPIWETEIYQKTVPIISVLTNMKLRLIIIAAVSVVAIIGLVGKMMFKKRQYFYWIAFIFGIIAVSLVLSIGAGKVLKDYQIKRLIVFLDPNTDPLGSGWNIIQSKIAIGSGGLFGQGFLKGTQSHYSFLPQQSTDFIFSILSEEWGFAGSIFVFALFSVILFRALFIMKSTTNTYGYYIATGITFMFFFHFIVNVGMVMGIMPITGIPLLFLSYGGTSLWTAMMCVGLLMSINIRRLNF